MVRPISEFSYGYAFTENLIRSCASSPTKAPKFPSLLEEAKLGFDVNIELPGAAVFFQFKVGNLLKRSTAREIATDAIPGLTVPYFRAAITRRDWSDQHKHLVELERLFPGFVFYAAPLAISESEFHNSYTQCRVHLDSVLISPNDIGFLRDDLQHHVIYKPGLADAWFCSEPRTVKTADMDSLGDKLNAALASAPPLKEGASAIKNAVLETIPSKARSEAEDIEERFNNEFIVTRGTGEDSTAIDLAVTREISRIFLGLEFFVAQPG